LIRRNLLPTTGKKTDTESLSYPINALLSNRTRSYGASMRRMNLQQTSCLLLLKGIHHLGKLNGGDVVAAQNIVIKLSYFYITLFIQNGSTFLDEISLIIYLNTLICYLEEVFFSCFE